MNRFIESMKRLYKYGLIDMVRILTLFNSGTITEEEKKYILDQK